MKFSAIIILFYPERPILLNNIRLLENNGWQVVVVDNSPQSHKSWLSSSVEFRHCPENAGIAHAQNIGLLLARQQGRDYAMLLDQDSHLTEHLLQTASSGLLRHSLVILTLPLMARQSSVSLMGKLCGQRCSALYPMNMVFCIAGKLSHRGRLFRWQCSLMLV